MKKSSKRLLRLRTASQQRRSQRIRNLAFEWLEQRRLLAAPQLATLDPLANTHTAPVDTDVTATFDQDIAPASVTDQTFVVHAAQTGRLLDPPNAVGTSAATVTLDPASNFHAGELIQATLTADVQNPGGEGLADPFVWQFRTGVSEGTGRFTDTGQTLGGKYEESVALADLDGDGDLDAFIVAYNQGDTIWWNDGQGTFSDSGQRLGIRSLSVALGDLDGDGDLDAFVADFAANRVWLNDGSGMFTNSGQSLGTSISGGVTLGDMDGDGDLDALVGNTTDQANRIWLNDGTGVFVDSGQDLGTSLAYSLELGDLDGDGDLDVFVGHIGWVPNEVWFNDGAGVFVNTGQSLGTSSTKDVALGDVDGDGDLDAVTANDPHPFHGSYIQGENKVWLNDGAGTFTDSGNSLGRVDSFTRAVALGDLDGDGDLDAFMGNWTPANNIWLNDGSASFTKTGQGLGSEMTQSVALGDLDGDRDLDAFVVNYENMSGQPDRVWQNGSEVHGAKWSDLDADGTWDSGEPGLLGWTIYVDMNQNSQLDAGEISATTDAYGNYSLTNVPIGTLRVAEVPRLGWTQTAPSVGYHTITLAVGQIATGVNFGNLKTGPSIDPTLTLEISNDSLSEADSPAATSATVTRNWDPSSQLVVTMINPDDTELYMPAEVTIPAGEASVQFAIEPLNDGNVDGDQAGLLVTASAPGFFDGTDTITVTDDDTTADRTLGGRLHEPIAAESYRVLSDIDVDLGRTLTLAPGSMLRFEPGTELVVAGVLIADAEAGSEILFTSGASTPTPADWAGIRVIAAGARIE